MGENDEFTKLASIGKCPICGGEIERGYVGEVKNCSHCGVEMEDYKVHRFRIGGKGGEWAFIVGDIAEIEEEPLAIHVYICPRCGKMELFANEQTMKILLSRQGLKKCVKCDKKIPLASEICPQC